MHAIDARLVADALDARSQDVVAALERRSDRRGGKQLGGSSGYAARHG
jgi:hypothetical protein